MTIDTTTSSALRQFRHFTRRSGRRPVPSSCTPQGQAGPVRRVPEVPQPGGEGRDLSSLALSGSTNFDPSTDSLVVAWHEIVLASGGDEQDAPSGLQVIWLLVRDIFGDLRIEPLDLSNLAADLRRKILADILAGGPSTRTFTQQIRGYLSDEPSTQLNIHSAASEGSDD